MIAIDYDKTILVKEIIRRGREEENYYKRKRLIVFFYIQVVRGIYVWCQGCAHGGHINHMREWFNGNRQCPVGCGHFCEYN